MSNMVVLVGKLTYIYDTDSIIEVTTVRQTGEEDQTKQDTIAIPVLVTESMMKHMKEYCNIGDIIGVKGSIKNRDNGIIIVGEKLSFLSSKSEALKGGDEDGSK